MTDIASLVVVPPLTITDTILVSSTVPETDYSAWSGATTYALDARCIIVATHKIYQSLQASNLNKAPATETAWWVEVSPTNRWKCFDTSNSTQTAQSTSAQYVLTPGQIVDYVGLLNIRAGVTFRAQLVDPTYGLVYDDIVYLSKILQDSSWYSFFIANKLSLSSSTLNSIPAYPDATLTVDIVGTVDLAFGILTIGQSKVIGQGVSYGARVSIQDYSRKEINQWGDTILVKRAYAKRASFNVRLNSGEVDTVNDYLAQLRATPCLWIGSNGYTSTMVFGIYENFETTIQYFDSSECSLNLLGLT